MSKILANQVIGRYRILEEIGKGGMGQVFLAEHIYTGKKIALKMLLSGWLSDLSEGDRLHIEERFRREALAAGQIAHENVVTVYDFDIPTENNPGYIAMEFINGKSLDFLLKSEGSFS